MQVFVRHTVADFETWKRGFDEHAAVRKEHHAAGHTLYRVVDDPNTVVAVTQFPTRADAEAFRSDPSLPEVMQRAGVLGAPEIVFLDDVEKVVY